MRGSSWVQELSVRAPLLLEFIDSVTAVFIVAGFLF